jgi:hypothetical protein
MPDDILSLLSQRLADQPMAAIDPAMLDRFATVTKSGERITPTMPLPPVGPSYEEAKATLWGLTGIPDIADAYSAAQRGEYLPAFGQGAAGLLGLLGLAVPLARGATSAARMAAPVAREAAAALPGLLADETGALRYPGAPPNVTSPQALGALRRDIFDLAQEGQPGRYFYENSGRAIGDVSGVVPGGDLTRASKLAEGIGITSPSAPVPANTDFAVRGHNQAMAGDPISGVGVYPTAMSERMNSAYWSDEPWGGRKTNNMYGNIMHVLDPSLPQGVTNDIWMMRGFGYPPTGDWQATKGGLFSGSPTKSQYDFVEKETNGLLGRLNENAATPWDKKQVQASIWTAIKSRMEGTDPSTAAFDYGDALRRLSAQQSYESIPGRTTGHLPEMFNSDLNLRQDFHRDITNAITDPQGRDIINLHFGLPTGKTFFAPGAFETQVNPGSQAQSMLGSARGSGQTIVDPASRDLVNMAEYTRGILLGQDAAAWHRPIFRESDPLKDRNLSDIMLGRPLTNDETARLYATIAREAGTDFYAPIGSPRGARFVNVPEVTGIDNRAFQAHVEKAVQEVFGDANVPGDVRIAHRAADSNYIPIDWQEILSGKDYNSGTPSGRPDLQRRSAELLSALGPKIAKIQDAYAQRYGWTVNPGVRVWERPGAAEGISPSGGAIDPAAAIVPQPPTPWTSGRLIETP